MDEVDVEHIPVSLAEALQYKRFEKQLQFRTSAIAGAGKRPAMFHGHDPSDEDKTRLLRWFHKLDHELSTVLVGEHSPLLLAGVDYLLPIYQEANTYPYLLDESIKGNPEELKPEELHAQSWPLVEPVFAQAQKEAAARYGQLAISGQATTDLQEAVLAAHHGRVDVLFVAAGVQVWGNCSPNLNTVNVHEDPELGDDDLLDLAAIQTILNNGTVYAVEPEQAPDQAPLAALFRY